MICTSQEKYAHILTTCECSGRARGSDLIYSNAPRIPPPTPADPRSSRKRQRIVESGARTSKCALRTSKNGPRNPKSAPWSSKSAPREPTWAPRGSKKGPNGVRGALKRVPGTLRVTPRSLKGAPEDPEVSKGAHGVADGSSKCPKHCSCRAIRTRPGRRHGGGETF